MKEFNSVGVPSLEKALKDYFKGLIDKGIYEVDITCINAEIMQVIDNLPQLPVVPLEVHERMKRELNEEISKLKANNERLTYCQVCEKCELETSTNQYFCNKYGGYVSKTDCCSRGNIKRNGG